MSYIPEWELLSDAVVQLVKSGIAESEARQQIAAAIADRAISVQVWTTEINTSHPWPGEVQIPSELTEADFDWAQSRPLYRWWFPQIFNPGLSKPRRVDRLKVSTKDLIRVFDLIRSFPAVRPEQEQNNSPAYPEKASSAKPEQASPAEPEQASSAEAEQGQNNSPASEIPSKQEEPFQAALNQAREKSGWNPADESHFRAMKQLLDGSKARSVADAARQIVNSRKVTGAGTVKSKCKRLERGYKNYAKSL